MNGKVGRKKKKKLGKTEEKKRKTVRKQKNGK